MTIEAPPIRRTTYGQILKTTALIGGSSIINVGFGIIRSKAMALLLGPTGVGLFGLYMAILDLTQSVAGMGIQESGVRQIAEAAGSEDAARVARTASVLRRISLVLGLLGGVLLAVFSLPVAELTFDGRESAIGVAILGLAVFFRLVSAGQTALIQGVRNIPDLARLSVFGAFFSTATTIPMVYLFGERGIVPALVAIAGASLLTSWWYSRKIPIARVSISAAQVLEETGGLLKLGVAFMASGFLTLGAAYVVRILVLHHAGIEEAGLYQAAWVLGGLYAGFILQAMGADFYPRLTAVAHDDPECNRLVNEQAEVSMLLAGPGVIATLTFAPLIMTTFYSAEFHSAASVLRWICLGMTLRIVAWPIGYVVLAKGAKQIFFWTELVATLLQVGLAWLLIPRVGLDGAGMAFFGLYVWHGILVYVIARRLSGFRVSAANKRLGLVFLPSTGLVFCGFLILPLWAATLIGVVAAFLSGAFSLRTLLKIVPPSAWPPALRRVLRHRA